MKASPWRSLVARTFRRGMPPNCAMSRSVEAKDILIAEVKVNTSEVPSCLHARVVGHILSKSLIKPRWSLEGSFAESPNQNKLAAAKVPIAAMPLQQPYGTTLGPDLLQCLMNVLRSLGRNIPKLSFRSRRRNPPVHLEAAHRMMLQLLSTRLASSSGKPRTSTGTSSGARSSSECRGPFLLQLKVYDRPPQISTRERAESQQRGQDQ